MTTDEIIQIINAEGLPITLLLLCIAGVVVVANKYVSPLVQSLINSNIETVKSLELINERLNKVDDKVNEIDKKVDVVVTDMSILKDRIK